jgi:Flp pilus assembly protein CpaB
VHHPPRPRSGLCLRLRARRHRPVTALAAAALAVLAAVTVSNAEQTADRYGPRQRVPVARHDLRPGEEIRPDDLEWRELPSLALPSGVVPDPSGRTVIQPILTGEAVVEARVAPDGRQGPHALVPPGARAIAVPVDPPLATLRVGDRVDLLALGRWVAREAVVVDIGDQAIVVAVGEHDVPAVARGVLDGSVIPVIVSPPMPADLTSR